MIRALKAAVLAVLLTAAFPAAAVLPDEILADPALEARARELSLELRCLVCQNQSIDDSNAELARDLRILVRERLVAGGTNAEALKHIQVRYGDFVLYRPEVKPLTWLLWFGPFALLLCGLVGMALYVRQRQGVQKLVKPLSEKERDQVRVLLKTGESP